MTRLTFIRLRVTLCLAGLLLPGWAMGFLNPPGYVGPATPAQAVDNRALTMVSSLAVTPQGRLWATWYAGVTPDEDLNNYVVLSTSGDNGKTWTEVLVVDPDGPGKVRAFDPELWMAPDGNLYWIWAQAVGHDGSVSGVWALKITNPEEAVPVYEKPVRWTDGIMMCKPLVLSDGQWALPVSTWRLTDNSARMVVSSNAGKTWRVRGAANVPPKDRIFDEHMIIERKDGSLWMLVRTNYGIGESVSTDKGKTWSEVAPSQIAHTSSRFYIERLRSGNILLVKHGPIGKPTGRSHLTAFLSEDDGKTWSDGLLLDERGAISYPDGQQAADGTIYITYDHSRSGDREILLASFQEEDVKAGRDVSARVRLREVISKGSGGEQADRDKNADGKELNKSPAGTFAATQYKTLPFKKGEVIFSDRPYKIAEVPAALEGFSFVQAPLGKPSTWVCEEAGTLYFLTPQPNRNKHSQSQKLTEQGFQKVSLPEIFLFDGNANRSSLYQKECAPGETVILEKWAVPLFLPAAR